MMVTVLYRAFGDTAWSVAQVMPREDVDAWKLRTFGIAVSLFEFKIEEAR